MLKPTSTPGVEVGLGVLLLSSIGISFLELYFCLSFPNVLIGNLYDENDLYYGSGDSSMYDRFPIRAFGNDRLRL